MSSSTPGTNDQPYEPEWSPFIKSFTTCLSQLRAEQYIVLQLQSRPVRYVQFAQDGPVGFRAESVSNYYLRDADLLTPDDEISLIALGWHTPVAPDDMTTEGPSNWHMRWSVPVPFSEVVELAVHTLTSVHQAHFPTDLSYRAFDQDDTEASFPILGIPKYVAVQQPVDSQPPESTSTYDVQTRRPLVGPVGEALALPNSQRDHLVQNILNYLDQGEGWTLQRDSGSTWYPGRLAVEFQCPPDDRVLRLDTRVADIQEEPPTLHSLLNELNINAAGWWWWIDHISSSVHCSINCAVDTTAWWWPSILMGVLPNYAATTEALADRLATLGRGSVVQASHPEKGPRPELDGWILGTRLGERQPVASLDLWLSTLELARLQAALGVLWPDYEHRVSWPLCASIVDNSGRVRVVLRRHWHPEFGWGWQIAAVSGITSPSENVEAQGLHLTKMLNERQARSSSAVNRFGGWSYVPKLGLAHLTFVPALEIELLLAAAGSTIGNIAALMMDVRMHLSDLQDAASVTLSSGSALQIDTTRADELDESAVQVKLSAVHIDVGPDGWPYRDQDLQVATLAGQEPDDSWLIPRHAIICSFGIFNPMGPTVSSLEAAYLCSDGGSGRWVLYFVMRHPLYPKLVRLGHSDTWDGLGKVISASLEDAERAFGTGPEWLDIQAHQAAVLAGTRKFAETHPDPDWRREAESLLTASSYPWNRVSPGFSPKPVDWPAGADPIDCWIAAVTNLDVIAGHQLFIRSAWDGVEQLAANNWSFEAAQASATRDQAVGLPRAQDDFEFRGHTEPFVKHATVVGPSELTRLTHRSGVDASLPNLGIVRSESTASSASSVPDQDRLERAPDIVQMPTSVTADPQRVRMMQATRDWSELQLVADAVAAASQKGWTVYIERLSDLYRWSLAHARGSYPLLRITALFLGADYQQIYVRIRTLPDGTAIINGDAESVAVPDEWTLLQLPAIVSPAAAAELIVSAIGAR